ncbi:aldo/keto reductase [Geomesophilobacter sediminis]|uniref:Aldo/keto reductase n=1 Tax=Geomesophilobacter sediminis TaxID=2798584 RepID=A0A8J7M0C4_9BACT|nr:aldo/keto reductase [Geomesophilobacter sediminis]MBJ6724452.1 aldo/keto reductase [Geomesophilobacter sediminis]
MQYRVMPKSGDSLSVLGFGCMRLPMKDGRIDEARAIAQIRSAIDSGVNYVDTAWPYHGGESEPLLGRALKDGYRDKVKLATKLPSWLITSREDMDRYLAAQLAKLGTDRIDYYLVHALDGAGWRRMQELGVADFLDKAKADGRIVNAGFSFHGLGSDFKVIVDAYPWVFCQIQFNYLDRQFQAGLEGLRYAAAKGVGVIVMEPLRGGNLGIAEPPEDVAAIWSEAKVRRTPVEWALRWVWNFPEVTLLLSGMNDESHIAQNIAIADVALPGSLTDEELALVDRVGNKYKQLMQTDCTGCGYCMPCPAGVNIPGCFDVYNKMHMFGNEQEAKFIYALTMSTEIMRREKSGYASQCVACGACVEKCPQQIAIPEMLAKVAAELEGPDLVQRIAIGKQVFQKEVQ